MCSKFLQCSHSVLLLPLTYDDTICLRGCLWPPYGVGQAIMFLHCGFFYLSSFFFFSSPNLSGRRLDVYHRPFHAWCGLSANLGLRCRSETFCTRLVENTVRKKSPKTRHLGTIAQLCRAISSQLRHLYRQSERS